MSLPPLRELGKSPCNWFGMYGSPKYIRQACENSLKRLEIDCIDLYLLSTSPIEDAVSTLTELVKEGKIKYISLSKCFAETLRRAYKVHPIAAVQVALLPQLAIFQAPGLCPPTTSSVFLILAIVKVFDVESHFL